MWWLIVVAAIVALAALVQWWLGGGARPEPPPPPPPPPKPDPLAGLADWWADRLRRARWADLLYAVAVAVAYWPWAEARPGQLGGRVRALLQRPRGPELKVSHRALGRALVDLGLGRPMRGRARRVLVYRLDRDRAQALVAVMRRDPARYLALVPLYQAHHGAMDALARALGDRPSTGFDRDWRPYLIRLRGVWQSVTDLGLGDMVAAWLDGDPRARQGLAHLQEDLARPIPRPYD